MDPIRYAGCLATSLQAARPWRPENLKPRGRKTPSELIDQKLINGYLGKRAHEA
jgi:hypothetical protein